MSEERTAPDPLVQETEEKGRREGGGRLMQAANLFDLRRIIGGLFVLYGALLTILGITERDAEIEKAAGVNINLWAGLGVLVVGALFLIWAFTRPLGEQLQEAEEGEGGESPQRAAPRGTDAAALASHQRSGRTRRDRDRPGGGGGPRRH